MYIQDTSLIVEAMNRFYAYIQAADFKKTGIFREHISFTDSNCILGREEDYKHKSAIKGLEMLQVSSWQKNWIGTGKIASRAIAAISKAGNLVNRNQQIDFKNRLTPGHPKYKPNAEQVLYDLYCGVDSESVFSMLVNTFGAKYDTIAFLFFMKSYEEFLPISPTNFDRIFHELGIDFSAAFHCGWNNYCEFIAIVREVQTLMNDILPLESTARLIDAHSFLWFINEEKFRNWNPDSDLITKIETRTEECLAKLSGFLSSKRLKNSLVYERNSQIVKYTRQYAKGICQLCNQPAPFTDKNGNPYLEVHHVIWLSRGGSDSIQNTVALCPNCHTKMHIVDDTKDIEWLQSIALAHK